MADGIGHSLIVNDRRFEDYRSMKQHFQHRHTKEFLFSRAQLSTAAAVEVEEKAGETIAILGSEATVYVRDGGVDNAGSRDKTMTIEYVDDAGAIQTATANTNDTDSTTEVEIATDFRRLRSFTSEIEAPADHHWVICNSNKTAVYNVIQDGRIEALHSRYRVPASTVCASYLGRIKIEATRTTATGNGHEITIEYTPKDRANHVETIDFWYRMHYEPCVELEPGSDVIFTIKKITDEEHLNMFFRSEILEVYAKV